MPPGALCHCYFDLQLRVLISIFLQVPYCNTGTFRCFLVLLGALAPQAARAFLPERQAIAGGVIHVTLALFPPPPFFLK